MGDSSPDLTLEERLTAHYTGPDASCDENNPTITMEDISGEEHPEHLFFEFPGDQLLQDLRPEDGRFQQLFEQLTEDEAAGVCNDEVLLELRQIALRERLHSHWYADRTRWCAICQERKTYIHGVFRNTKPSHPPEPMSAEEASSQAEPMNKSVWADFKILEAIIERYEVVIQKRWAKKSITKRKEALQSAWIATSNPPPQPLPKMHRPEMDFLRSRCNKYKQICNCGVVDEAKRHLFLWPRLNLEDLTKVEPLLLLLNARGRHSPPTFAFADLETVHFGVLVDQMSHPRFLDLYSMVFTGQQGPEVYGQLVSWSEDPMAYQRLHMGRDTSPGEGLWILEIQQRLYRFLVNICQVILHDQQVKDLDRLLAQPVAPEPALPTANGHDQDTGTSLMITRYESAYHVPAKLDIRRLQNLVESKLAEAEDTLWALREDPGFFATTLAEMYQSRPEHLRDTANKCHPSIMQSDAKDRLMAQTVGMVWCQHVSAVERWGLLYEKVSQLAELKERLFDNAQVPIRPEDDLPSELAFAIYSLLHNFHNHLGMRLKHILARAQCSPALRHLYRRGPSSDSSPCPNKVSIEDVPIVSSGLTPSPEVMEFLWVLEKMSHPGARRCFGLHNCVEEIERISHDRAGHKIISKLQAAEFSEYTIVSECLRQLEMFQPWAATFEACMADDEITKELNAQYEVTVSKQTPFATWTPSTSTCTLGAMLANMPYPVEKAPTKSNIDAICKAEGLLDAFWEAALPEFENSELITERLTKLLLENKPERTAVWTEPSKTGTGALQNEKVDVKVHAFDIGLGDTQRTLSKLKLVEPRVKVKSRGVARSSSNKSEAIAPRQDPQPSIVSSIGLDQRALKAVEMLFHRALPGSSRGEIPWTEFIYLMHYVGFGVEKLGGSSWQFTPGSILTARGYVRGIQFHEPHPKAKLAFVLARQYGRRLARTYGWCAEMFRLKTA